MKVAMYYVIFMHLYFIVLITLLLHLIKTSAAGTLTQTFAVQHEKTLNRNWNYTVLIARSSIQCATFCAEKRSCRGASFNNVTRECRIVDGHTRNIETEISEDWRFLKEQIQGSLCETNWVSYDGHCYLFSKSRRSWSTAQYECEQSGSNLVKIDDDYENAWITTLLKNKNARSFWIGLTYKRTHNKWLWISDSSTLHYTKWDFGKLNNRQSYKDCCELNVQHSYRWNDKDCSEWNFYICEK